MRIADMGDMGTHKAGKTVRVGKWHYVDGVQPNGDPSVRLRYVYHYGTCMAVLITGLIHGGEVGFVPYTMGWGSVSDQNGMNAILRRAGVPLVYRRNGGEARYEEVAA